MKELKNVMYKITALSNLHVGSGDQNYGIVDKLVQRDALTGFPVIHSSSLKGALKVYCVEEIGLKKDDDAIIASFGSGENPGKDKFFSAHLFTIPVRSSSRPFYRATCPVIINEMAEMLKAFGLSNTRFSESIMALKKETETLVKKFTFFENNPSATLIEEHDVNADSCNNPITSLSEGLATSFCSELQEMVIIRDDIFMEICENLPVIARNRLDEQKNLWYEEVVPRQSEFLFLYMGTDETRDPIMGEIVKRSCSGTPVQIGANASVGYGFCKIEKIA